MCVCVCARATSSNVVEEVSGWGSVRERGRFGAPRTVSSRTPERERNSELENKKCCVIKASPAVGEKKHWCLRHPPGPCPCQNEGHQKCKVAERGGGISDVAC